MSLYAAAVIVYGIAPLKRGFDNAETGIDVYLRSNGAHADLVLPIKAADVDLASRLPLGALNLNGTAAWI